METKNRGVENKPSRKIQRTKRYLVGLMIYLCIAQILEMYASSFPMFIISSVQKELFIDRLGYTVNQADAAYADILLISSIGLYFGTFTRLFADFTGRRIWLFITAFGFGIGSLVVGLAPNSAMLTVGLLIINIFYNSDFWSIYIAEEAPKEKRGILQNVVLLVGLFAGALFFLVKVIYIDNRNQWRPVALYGTIGIIVALFTFLLDETGPYKEIHMARKKSGAPKPNPFKNYLTPLKGEYGKGMFPILLVMVISGFTGSVQSMMEPLLTRYLGDDATTSMLAVMMGWAVFSYLGIGWAMDKLGRNPVKIIAAIIGPIGATLFILGLTRWGWTNFWLLGTIYGFNMIAFTGLLTPNRMAGYETVSTNMRGTAASMMALTRAIGQTLGLIATRLLIGAINLEWASIIISFFYILAIPVTLIWGRETKGIDVRTI